MATIEYMPARLTPKDTEDLRQAVACLEGASFAQRLTDAVGRPVGMLSRTMPQPARRVIAHVSETALRGALKLALRTLDLNAHRQSPPTALTSSPPRRPGPSGGALGLAALPLELPISTTILLRSIAEIAREEGEDLSVPEAAFACVEVFALGGQGDGESGLRERLFRRSGRARQVGQRQRALCRRSGGRRPSRASGGAADLADRGAFRHRGEREGRGPGGANPGRNRRRGGQRRLRRPFPDIGARAFHRAAPGASARRRASSRSNTSACGANRDAATRKAKGPRRRRNGREPAASAQRTRHASRPCVGDCAFRPARSAVVRGPRGAGPTARRRRRCVSCA